MPFISAIKNYVIESEDEIPEEYREEVERRLGTSQEEKEVEELPITPGRRERFFLREDEIAREFSDDEEYYFGHGTPGNEERNEERVDSIFEIGLKVTVPAAVAGHVDNLTGLTSTTITFRRRKRFFIWRL